MESEKNIASKTVVRCYDLLDASISGGVEDFTDGKYFGNSNLSYEKAQENQAEWLLDKIGCKKGSVILDVGCGNGRLLKAAKSRGANAIGITISEPQVNRAKVKGLDARLMDYRLIPEDWDNYFDGIIANGSLEHFVQVKDALSGRQDQIYKEMFRIFYRILKSGGRLVTTAIHFNQNVNSKEIIKGSEAFKRGTSNFHFSKVLLDDFGGWYPAQGQLENNAKGFFTLKESEDGTEDYQITSEYWLAEMRKQILINPKVWFSLLGKLMRYPKAMINMTDNLLFSQSWMWQFRPQDNGETPTKLFRDVWIKDDKTLSHHD